MIKTISYLGLGTMGSGMASNLLKTGYQLTVWNRSVEKCEPFARRFPQPSLSLSHYTQSST
jgi:3-hydroxyisobutyrate dehydrogenase-like beta-hydroxyacid dehydrogenase